MCSWELVSYKTIILLVGRPTLNKTKEKSNSKMLPVMVHEDVSGLSELAVGVRVMLRVAEVVQAATVFYHRDRGGMSK